MCYTGVISQGSIFFVGIWLEVAQRANYGLRVHSCSGAPYPAATEPEVCYIYIGKELGAE